MNCSACGVVMLLVIPIWLAIPATHVSGIFAVGGDGGDSGRNHAVNAGTDLNTTITSIIFHSNSVSGALSGRKH